MISNARLYTIKEISELPEFSGMSQKAIWRIVVSGKIKSVPSAKNEKIRVLGKFLNEYLGIK